MRASKARRSWLLTTSLVVALSAGPVSPASAQEPIARGGQEPVIAETVERTLFALEEEWTHAVVRRDGAAFEPLLAPRFVYTETIGS